MWAVLRMQADGTDSTSMSMFFTAVGPVYDPDPTKDIRYEYDASNVTECKFVENTYTDTETTDTEPPDPEGGDTNGTD